MGNRKVPIIAFACLLLQIAPVEAEERRFPSLPASNPCEQVARFELYEGDAVDAVAFVKLDGLLAERVCRAELAKAPDDPRLKLLLARALIKIQRWTDAEELAAALVEQGYLPANLLLAAIGDGGHAGTAVDSQALVRAASNGSIPLAQLAEAESLLRRPGADPEDPELRALLEATARQRFPKAQYLLGWALLQGEPSAADVARALRLLKPAAEAGIADAQYQLGLEYDLGDHVAADKVTAVHYYEMAASQGHLQAKVDLGFALYRGDGVAKDRKRALGLMREAAEAKDVFAMTVLGRWLTTDPSSLTEGEDWLRQAADSRDVYAMESLGNWLVTKPGASREGEDWLRKAAAGGDPDAMAALGRWLVKQPASRTEGTDWLLKSAWAGNPDAMLEVGTIMIEVPATAADGRSWLEKSANAGNRFAASELGEAWASGKGGAKDAAEAAEWFRKSAAAGYDFAMYRLAEMTTTGEGVVKDPAAAKDWYLKAGDAGYAFAFASLADRILDGTIPGKPEEAGALLQRAADAGEVYSMYRLGSLLVAGNLLKKDFERGQALLAAGVRKDYPYAQVAMAELKSGMFEQFGGSVDFNGATQLLEAALPAFKDGPYADDEMRHYAIELLVWIAVTTGRFTEAEERILSTLAELKNAPDVALEASLVASLCSAYVGQGRAQAAIELIEGELSKHIGEEDGLIRADLLTIRGEAAMVLEHPEEAADFYRQALEAGTAPSSEASPQLAYVFEKLGEVQLDLGLYEEAAQTFAKAVDLRQQSAGGETPLDVRALAGLAQANARLGNKDAATDQFTRTEQKLGQLNLAISPEIARGLMTYALFKADVGDKVGARGLVATIAAQYQRRESALARTLSPGSVTERRTLKATFLDGVKVLLQTQSGSASEADLGLAFQLTQMATGQSAALGIQSMVDRFLTENRDETVLIREYQDAVVAYSNLAQHSFAAGPGQGNVAATAEALLQKMQMTRAKLDHVDMSVARDLATLSQQPVGLRQVQDALKPDEAMLLYAFGKTQSYVWVAREGAVAVKALPITKRELQQKVIALRLHLDPTALQPGAYAFPVAKAAELYNELVKPVADALQGVDRLIIVPDGPLESLPMSVLVSDPRAGPGDPSLRNVAWLARRFAMSYVPSAASLVQLRKISGIGGLHRLVAFGDPVSPKNLELEDLPETRAELVALAKALGEKDAKVTLGAAATETAAKAANYKGIDVLAFATHGLMAGETAFNTETALVLSASANDDGLLTASEVSTLKLDLQLVILSACNTASGLNTQDQEALSGLARAFLYAGTRSLLVSHWSVVSSAAESITTSFISDVAARDVSMAEALRASLLKIIDRGPSEMTSHPAYWAPFILVGVS